MRVNNQNMYYPNYYSGYNNYYNAYPTNPYAAFYQPYTQNLPNLNILYQTNTDNIGSKNNQETKENLNKEPILEKNVFENEEETKESFRIGPLDISKDKISVFGFSIEIDDLILIALILFLFFETDCDYSILIVLGLMLFNISFSSLDLF